MVAIVKYGLALLLAFEGLRSLLWVARIASVAAAYDVTVLIVVALRAMVTALQLASAVLLVRGAPPAVALARLSWIVSAALLVCEVGFRLAPTSVPPWLRWQVVAAYVAYAAVCFGLLSIVRRSER